VEHHAAIAAIERVYAPAEVVSAIFASWRA
jgi:hypothetical protein